MELKELIKRTDHIPSSVYEPEQALWLKYLKDLPGTPMIVDFGTGWGRSAASLALACPQAMVTTFDIGVTYVQHGNVKTLEEYKEVVAGYLGKAGVTNVKHEIMNSLDPNSVEGEEPFIDVLNIDSDHSYEATVKEMAKWIPLVKKGGIIMFHDFEHPNAPGVGEAIHELVSYKDGNKDYTDDKKPYKLELIDKAYHPKVTTAIFIKK